MAVGMVRAQAIKEILAREGYMPIDDFYSKAPASGSVSLMFYNSLERRTDTVEIHFTSDNICQQMRDVLSSVPNKDEVCIGYRPLTDSR